MSLFLRLPQAWHRFVEDRRVECPAPAGKGSRAERAAADLRKSAARTRAKSDQAGQRRRRDPRVDVLYSQCVLDRFMRLRRSISILRIRPIVRFDLLRILPR